MPTHEGLPNNIMHPTRCMSPTPSQESLRAGDDERSKDHATQIGVVWLEC